MARIKVVENCFEVTQTVEEKVGRVTLKWQEDAENDSRETKVNKKNQTVNNRDWEDYREYPKL
jgi:hypothetical protein